MCALKVRAGSGIVQLGTNVVLGLEILLSVSSKLRVKDDGLTRLFAL